MTDPAVIAQSVHEPVRRATFGDQLRRHARRIGAARASLQAVANALLESHLKACHTAAMSNGGAAARRRDARGNAHGVPSRSCSSSCAPDTPSIMQWCTFWNSALRPPSRPSRTRSPGRWSRPVRASR